MIKVNIEGSEYTIKELMKECSINDYQKLQNILDKKENSKYDIFDKLGECLSFLSDIPEDLIDLINVVQLKDLFDKATYIKFDEDYKVKNSFTIDKVKYKTLTKFEKYNDIVLNRLQYKIVKNVNNHILTLSAVVFLEDNDKELKTNLDMKNVKGRMEIFKDKVKFKDLLPYLVKWIETTGNLTKNEINVIKDLKLGDK